MRQPHQSERVQGQNKERSRSAPAASVPGLVRCAPWHVLRIKNIERQRWGQSWLKAQPDGSSSAPSVGRAAGPCRLLLIHLSKVFERVDGRFEGLYHYGRLWERASEHTDEGIISGVVPAQGPCVYAPICGDANVFMLYRFGALTINVM
jgi:hypothetical protein